MLSITVILPYGGCVRTGPTFRAQFGLKDAANFPQLRELELNGYSMPLAEWDIWQKGLDWPKLTSLTLGRQLNGYFLNSLQNVVLNLRVLKISAYAEEALRCLINVESVLRSFKTLEELVLDGFMVSVEAIARHSKLMSLHMHKAENPREGESRPTLSAADVEYLSKICPYIESLQLDFNRDGEWVSALSHSRLVLSIICDKIC